MNKQNKELNDLSFKITGCAYEVHKTLGPGLLESTYELCLCHEFEKRGIKFERQKVISIIYKDAIINNAYKMDILVDDKIIIELKSVDSIQPIHTAQLLTYLKLSKKELGLLINFNSINLQNGIRRYINNPC